MMIYNVLKEISDFCETCPSHKKCIEDKCVLYRIEEIILKALEEQKEDDKNEEAFCKL